jgi:hypothetical protein
LSPAYFFWISFICGWMSCRFRCALICLTNSGISRIRMTMTRPTMDRPHAAPLAAPKMGERSAWNVTRIQETAISSHSRMNMIPPWGFRRGQHLHATSPAAAVD